MARSLMPFSRNLPMSRPREDMDPFLVMRRQMNRLFDDIFGDFPLPGFDGSVVRQMASPKINVSETDKELRISAEIPGVKADDIEVMLDEDSLTIRGEIKQEREDQDKDRNYHVRERFEGAFSRTLPLPFRADPGKVQASFRDGVLTITMPKPEEVQQKQQRVQVQQDTSTSGATSSQSAQSEAGTTGGTSSPTHERAATAPSSGSSSSPGHERATTGSSSGSSAQERATETAAE
jgi:HSP20 family protein